MQKRTGLGKFIKARRNLLGMTQAQLADAIDAKDRSYITRVETGDIELPGPDIRRRLAAALGVRTVDLMAAAGEIDASELEDEDGISPRVRELASALDHLTPQHLRYIRILLEEMIKTQGGR